MSRAEADAIAELTKSLHGVQLLELDDMTRVLVHPTGVALKSIKPYLDEYLMEPERRTGVSEVFDLPSFIEHANRFRDDDSAIFANPSRDEPKLVAVLNYHRKGYAGGPRFGDHRTLYAFPLSESWKRWTSMSGATMNQVEFAEFIEDNLTDLDDPNDAGGAARDLMLKLDCSMATPAKILELSKGLKISVNSRVVNAVNLSSGEATVNFEATHQDEYGGPLRIPGAFMIAIPVFRNGPVYRLAARLRYRKDGTRITWIYKLHRDQETFDHAFAEAAKQAATETKMPLILGVPER